MLRRLLLVFLLSVVSGLGTWYMTHSILLPVESATDKQGHGPDPGSAEWNSSIARLTARYQKNAVIVGVSAFGLVLSLGGILTVTFAMAKHAGRE